MIKCRPGHERELILSLMQKFVDLESEPDRRLLIQSAIAPDHLHGTIYVEAEKEAHVRAAINGLHNLISWKVKLVPINEMTDVLKVPPKEYQLQKGSWVRVKRGVYAGDIAQVVEVLYSSLSLSLCAYVCVSLLSLSLTSIWVSILFTVALSIS